MHSTNSTERQLYIRELCPPFYRYLANTYQISAKMIINDRKRTKYFQKRAQCRVDVTAMGMYAVGTRPLVDILHDKTKCQQCLYASSGGETARDEKVVGTRTP